MFLVEQSISFYRNVMCCEICRDVDVTDGGIREQPSLFYGCARGTYIHVYIRKTRTDIGETGIDF